MRTNFFHLSTIANTLVLATCLTMVGRTTAAPVTYNVVGGSSVLTLSGQAFTLPYGGQGGNSSALVDSWTGTITGDLTAGVLTLSGGSSITAVLNPLSPFSTTPFPPAGGTDNYGPFGQGFVTGYGIVTVNGAYRNLVLDITAGTVTSGAAPAGMTLAFTGGKLDWGATTGLGPTGGTSSLVGVSGANTSALLASLDAGTGYGSTLILPVTFHTTGSNRAEDWTGTIVAVIPEPSAIAMLAVGLVALLGRRSRKARY